LTVDGGGDHRLDPSPLDDDADLAFPQAAIPSVVDSGDVLNAEERQSLARDLVAAAVLRGDFTLRSGQKSSWYLDKYRLTTEPQLLTRIVDGLATLLPAGNEGIDRIAGTALGAVPLATALSLWSSLPSIFVRVDAAKDHGTAKAIEGVLNAGDRVLVVEDVVTTGGASLTAVDLLQAAGATVTQVVAVVDREQGGREKFGERGVPFAALFTATQLGLGGSA
jgi:orotate phosphoribosyltransferase